MSANAPIQSVVTGSPNWTVSDRVRLPFSFDPERLLNDLRRVEGDKWIEHFVKQNYEGDWQVLPLRGPAGARHPVMMIYPDPAATAFEDGALLAQTHYFRQVLARFECPLQCVRLMRLKAGSRIKRHRDSDLDFESGFARIHVPITTNPDVQFLLNETPVTLAPGSAWYLRLSDPHSVANAGTTDRVHLVIDAVADRWLGDALAGGSA